MSMSKREFYDSDIRKDTLYEAQDGNYLELDLDDGAKALIIKKSDIAYMARRLGLVVYERESSLEA